MLFAMSDYEHITIESTHSHAETVIGLCVGAVFVGMLLSLASLPTNGLLGYELHLTLTSIWVLVALACGLILYHSFRAKLHEWQPPKPIQPELAEWEIITRTVRQYAWWMSLYLKDGDMTESRWLPVTGQKWQLPFTGETFKRKHYDVFTGAAREFGLVANRKQGATGIMTTPPPSEPSRVSRKSRKPVSETSA